MLPTKTHEPTLSLTLPEQSNDRLELSRLMAAAVLNPKFCTLLLTDPAAAIDNGFQGEEFSFSAGERDLILSIRSNSLADLADQLARTFDERFSYQMVSNVRKAESYLL